MSQILALTIAILAFLCGCSDNSQLSYQGYVEGEFVYVAPQLGGTLDQVMVNKGDVVAEGQPLFVLEHDYETQAVEQAKNRLEKALSRVTDLKKGKRPSEIQGIKAQLKKAKSQLSLAKLEYERRVKLYKTRSISEESLDRSSNDYRRADQQVAEIKAELVTAQLGSRVDQIAEAEAEARAEAASLDQAKWRLDQKTVSAPRKGLIFDTIRYQGEYVPAGNPVFQMLPPGNVRLRFFIPEPKLGTFQTGQQVWAMADGLPDPIPAHINYVSPRVEYTPPVIYSSQMRAKLTFMVEAKPEPAFRTMLHPGQPVDIFLSKPEPVNATNRP